MQTKTILIRGGLVQDAVHREPRKVDLLLASGKIAAIGENLDATADDEVFDAAGLQVFPGFVDAHTHIGLDGYGIGYEGCDYNEMNDIWTPQLRAIDGINPRDPSLSHARKAGVTCVCTGPGSANVLGGTFLAMKTTKFLIKRTRPWRSSLEIAFTCFSGKIPLSSTITGISLEGNKPPSAFLNCLFFCSSKSLSNLLSSCSSESAGFRSIVSVSSFFFNICPTILLALITVGPLTPKCVNKSSPNSS